MEIEGRRVARSQGRGHGHLIKACVVAAFSGFLALGIAADAQASSRSDGAVLRNLAAADPGLMPVALAFRSDADLNVQVDYLQPHGQGRIDASGSHYHVGQRHIVRGTVTYPPAYWRADYPLYTPGRALTFRVRIENRSKRTLDRLEVAAVQEYLHFFGKDGDDLPGQLSSAWTVGRLAPGASWQGEATVTLPVTLEPGLSQTHVQVQRRVSGRRRTVISDAPQAGLFCPREPAAVTAMR